MKYPFLFLILAVITSCKTEDNREINFPKFRENVTELPKSDNFWIFLLAGQSNMAGRGFVEPVDTLPNNRVISLGKNGQWQYAKEPLNLYEPNMVGLDCGLSFAKELLKGVPDSISIGLVHCAVGGTSIDQWNNDETFRGVTLLSNFRKQADLAREQGTVKGILWHQGESDAKTELIPQYGDKVNKLFAKFRRIVKNDSLPILVGELGAFKESEEAQERWNAINGIIREEAQSDKNRFVISTKDFGHKGDKVHFDSKSQREMGVRFAKKYVEEKRRIANANR